jgi:hypothetical protein
MKCHTGQPVRAPSPKHLEESWMVVWKLQSLKRPSPLLSDPPPPRGFSRHNTFGHTHTHTPTLTMGKKNKKKGGAPAAAAAQPAPVAAAPAATLRPKRGATDSDDEDDEEFVPSFGERVFTRTHAHDKHCHLHTQLPTHCSRLAAARIHAPLSWHRVCLRLTFVRGDGGAASVAIPVHSLLVARGVVTSPCRGERRTRGHTSVFVPPRGQERVTVCARLTRI